YVDASYRVFTSPRRVRFMEQEYAIPRQNLAAVLAEIRALFTRRDWRISFPIEVRVAPPDDIWLSTAQGRDTAYIAIHVFHASPHEKYFRDVEAVMTAAGGRPHWGKLHTRDAAYLRAVYPEFGQFVALRDTPDPDRRFTNPHLEPGLGRGAAAARLERGGGCGRTAAGGLPANLPADRLVSDHESGSCTRRRAEEIRARRVRARGVRARGVHARREYCTTGHQPRKRRTEPAGGRRPGPPALAGWWRPRAGPRTARAGPPDRAAAAGSRPGRVLRARIPGGARRRRRAAGQDLARHLLPVLQEQG